PQLTVFALELLEPLTLLARQTRPLPRIPLAPPNPAAQRLGRTADLLCDRLDRRPFRFILVRVLADQPNRPLPHLRRVLLCSCHGSNFSKVGASGKLGAIQGRDDRIDTTPSRQSTRPSRRHVRVQASTCVWADRMRSPCRPRSVGLARLRSDSCSTLQSCHR